MFAAVLDALSDVVVVVDSAGAVRYVNSAAERLLGYDADDWMGRSPFELFHPDDVGPMTEALVICRDEPGVHEPMFVRVRTADDEWRLFEIVGNSLFDDRDIEGIVIVAREVSGRAAQQASLANERRRFELAFEHASIGMSLFGRDGRYLRVNGAYADLLGYSPNDFSTMTIASVSHPDGLASIEYEFTRLLDGETDAYQLDERLRRADGTWLWVRMCVSAIRDETGEILELLGQAVDISDARALAERLEHDATHDHLTGLASRSLLFDSLDRALARAERDADPVGVLVIDLDRFKDVNDTHGHAVGDRLLVDVAQRLRDVVRASDLVARIGGDEFVLMLPAVNGLREASEVAERVVASLGTPFQIDEAEVHSGASVGVAISTPGERTVATVMARADEAAYRAKAEGRSTHRIAA